MKGLRKKLFAAAGTATLALSLAAGAAFAQGEPVGTPGEPQCYGGRVSAGFLSGLFP